MTIDEIIKIAKEAGFIMSRENKLTHCGYYVDDKLIKFTELILASQHPVHSESGAVAEVRCRNDKVFGFISRKVFRDMLPLGTKLYTKPQPTSQDVLIKTYNTQVILDLQEQLAETIKQRNYWQDMAGNYANGEHEAKEQLANAELTIQTMSKATHPTPSRSEPVAKYKKEDSTFQLPLWLTHQEKYSKELGRGYSPLFAVPQPTSQDDDIVYIVSDGYKVSRKEYKDFKKWIALKESK